MTQTVTRSTPDITMLASNEWARRPLHERYLSLEEMLPVAGIAKRYGREVAGKARQLQLQVKEGEVGSLYVGGLFENQPTVPATFTYESFGQLCSRVGAPAGYLRTLPVVNAAADLQFGLAHREEALEPAKFYAVPQISGGEALLSAPGQVYAVTGPKYGRIFNFDVIRAVQRMNANSGGIWKVPAASYMATDPRRATTLYLGRGSVFLFLVDEDRLIDVNGRKLNRLIIVQNSEIGDRTLRVTTGTHDFVCDNRMIWGARNVEQIAVRHTSGAPERFIQEVEPAIRAYAERSTSLLEFQLRKAAETPLTIDGKRVASNTESQVDWLKRQGFSGVLAQVAVVRANAEEGGFETVWQAVQGVTAAARDLKPYADERMDVEEQAGQMLDRLVPVKPGDERSAYVSVPALPYAAVTSPLAPDGPRTAIA